MNKVTYEDGYKITEYESGAVAKVKMSTEPMMELNVTSMSSDDPNNVIDLANNELTCKVGSEIIVEVQILTLSGSPQSIIEINQLFRMPIKGSGNDYYAIANFVQGEATITLTLDKSGLWQVTEESVNQSLPASSWFKLEKPVQIFVYL